ncbi:MAG: phosphotransferase, partial [Leptospiraceae bacterium]|nr:phosphotransferase [Leptospiraceae bacterium]
NDEQVLKLFFPEISESEIRKELANTEAAALAALPAAHCHGTVEIDGRHGILLDRIRGISLTQLPEKHTKEFFALPRYLAQVHMELHKRTAPGLEDFRELVESTLDKPSLAFLSKDEKNRIRNYLSLLPQGDRALHLDFHPENIIVAGDRKVVIDWMTAARGVPAADVAFTVFLLRDAELFPGISTLKRWFYETVRRFILKGYLSYYLKHSGLSMADLEVWRLPVLLLRLGIWGIESERSRLKSWILEKIPEGEMQS